MSGDSVRLRSSRRRKQNLNVKSQGPGNETLGPVDVSSRVGPVPTCPSLESGVSGWRDDFLFSNHRTAVPAAAPGTVPPGTVPQARAPQHFPFLYEKMLTPRGVRRRLRGSPCSSLRRLLCPPPGSPGPGGWDQHHGPPSKLSSVVSAPSQGTQGPTAGAFGFLLG